MTKFYQGENRAETAVGGGRLVAKQIERLYGNRATSPEEEDSSSSTSNGGSTTPERKVSGGGGGGFFAKRFGITKQKDRHSPNDKTIVDEKTSSPNGSPLDFKPLKVPAVFRLLRPEFRDQLKNSSCQIPNDQTTPKRNSEERVIPITMSNGRSSSTVLTVDQQRKKSEERVIPVESAGEKTNGTTPVKPKPRERVIPIQKTGTVASSEDSNNAQSTTITTTSTTTTTNNNKSPDKTPRSPLKPALPTKPLSPPPVTSPGLVSQVQQNGGGSSLVKQQSAKIGDQVEKDFEKACDSLEKQSLEKTPTRTTEVAPAAVPPVVARRQLIPKQDGEPEKMPEPQTEEAPVGTFPTASEDPIVEEEEIIDEEMMDDQEAFDYDVSGVHERALLCTILEEDNESTASGSQLNLLAASTSSLKNGSVQPQQKQQQSVMKGNNATSLNDSASSTNSNGSASNGAQQSNGGIPQEVQDGHYFIKVMA